MNVTGTVRTAFVGLLFASGAANAAWVIDFEQFGNGNIINSQLSGEVAPGANVGVTIFGDNKQINGGVTDVFADPPTGLQTTGTQRDIAVVFSTDENDHAQAPEDQDLLALDSTGNQIGLLGAREPGFARRRQSPVRAWPPSRQCADYPGRQRLRTRHRAEL